MKKLIVIILLLIFPIKISAKSVILEQEYNNELWYVMKEDKGNYFSRQYVKYNIEENAVFCIQPGVEITTNKYTENDLSNSPYTEEINQKLELIGYYGYDYPNHQTLKYRMATQALIWETVSGKKIEFWTGYNATGEYINIEQEKNEILKLIDDHNIENILNYEIIETNVNEEVEISINFIDNYEIIKNEKFNYRIDGKKLYITPLVVGNIELEFKQKLYDDLKTIIYKGENSISQNVALLRNSKPKGFKININSFGKIEIFKYGEKQLIKNNELVYEEIPLENVEFRLYAYNDIKNRDGTVIFRKNDLISNNTSDKNGFLIYDNLSVGTYKLVETKALHNYILDNKEYIIEIKEGDSLKNIKIKNELKKTIIEVPSTGKNKKFFLETILIFLGVIIVSAKKIKTK